MQMDLVLYAHHDTSGQSAQLHALAQCHEVGFKLHLHGAAWIASYLELLLALAADSGQGELALSHPRAVAALVREHAEGTSVPIAAMKLPLSFQIDVPSLARRAAAY
jgi:hypothetical protein